MSTDCPDDAVQWPCATGWRSLLDHDPVRPPLELHDGAIVAEDVKISIGDLWDVYRSCGGRRCGRALATGATLVNAWQQRPRPVEPNRRLTDRVIPARLAMAETSNNPRGCCSVRPLTLSTGPTASNW